MTNEELVANIQSGTDRTENLNKLWLQNKGMIYQIAKRYIGYEEIDDLLQVGFEGLCKAVEHYKPIEEVSFIYYATFWIKATMQRHIENCSSVVRIPVYARTAARQYRRFVSDYQKEYGCSPSDKEIKDILGVSDEKLEIIKNNAIMEKIRSLDKPLDTEEGEVTLCDMVADASIDEDDIIKKVDTEIMTKELWAAVEELPADMADIIRGRYKNQMTMRELGEINGKSIERIRQMQASALRKLRVSKHCKGCKRYYIDYISSPVFKLGVNEFNRTWTSAVEREVLNHLD